MAGRLATAAAEIAVLVKVRRFMSVGSMARLMLAYKYELYLVKYYCVSAAFGHQEFAGLFDIGGKS